MIIDYRLQVLCMEFLGLDSDVKVVSGYHWRLQLGISIVCLTVDRKPPNHGYCFISRISTKDNYSRVGPTRLGYGLTSVQESQIFEHVLE